MRPWGLGWARERRVSSVNFKTANFSRVGLLDPVNTLTPTVRCLSRFHKQQEEQTGLCC